MNYYLVRVTEPKFRRGMYAAVRHDYLCEGDGLAFLEYEIYCRMARGFGGFVELWQCISDLGEQIERLSIYEGGKQ